MDDEQIDRFILYQARTVARIYRSSHADEDDYIQVGRLKLAEINKFRPDKSNCMSYAVTSISRAMRQEALATMSGISAPDRVKSVMHKVEMMFVDGKTEKEVCDQLKLTVEKLADLLSLMGAKSWENLFIQPKCYPDPFSVLDDLFSSKCLKEEDRDFILDHFVNDTNDSTISRKQKWKRSKDLRPRLIRSGYGI